MDRWTDHLGVVRRVPSRCQRPVYGYPNHAALRVFVYRRDEFTCQDCGAMPASVPIKYSGFQTLEVVRRSRAGFPRYLVIDHIVSIRNGGDNHPDNLRTLCDCCNAAKVTRVDRKYTNTVVN